MLRPDTDSTATAGVAGRRLWPPPSNSIRPCQLKKRLPPRLTSRALGRAAEIAQMGSDNACHFFRSYRLLQIAHRTQPPGFHVSG
jgi:hypothetical protein